MGRLSAGDSQLENPVYKGSVQTAQSYGPAGARSFSQQHAV
jgi:hypothetical protein